jgi:transposase
MADTRSMWRQRVAGWRGSGLTADAYSRRHGFAASSLRWWSSKLAREEPAKSPVRFAQLVRSPTATGEAGGRGSIVIEVLDARVRLTADPGADRETVAHVIELVLRRVVR